MRLTYYYTERKKCHLSRSFYHDAYNNFVNYVMTGVDYLNHGLEFGLEGTIWGGLTGQAVAAFGQHLYTSRPVANIYVDQLS